MMDTALLNVEVIKQLGWHVSEERHSNGVVTWFLTKAGMPTSKIMVQDDNEFKSYTNGARDFCGDLNAAWPLWVDYVENGALQLLAEPEDEIFGCKTPEAAATGIVKVWLGFKGVDVKALNGQG